MKILTRFVCPLAALVFGAAIAPAQAAEVELLDAFTITHTRYGNSQYSETFRVAVANPAASKQVYIHREQADGSWIDIPMYYYGPSGSGKELWQISDSNAVQGDEFVVKLVAGNEVYWDNNNGSNYTINSEGYLLGAAKKVSVASYFVSATADPNRETLHATLALDNIAPAKNVQLVYSVDNWQSSTAVPATYNGNPVYYGYGAYPNPNLNNTESWSVVADIPAGVRGEFYVVYSVDGHSYYDSNNGANHPFNLDSLYGQMTVRVAPNWYGGYWLKLVDDNLWAGNIYFDGGSMNAFKFDAYDDWSVNFGDNEGDGIAESNGANIPAPLQSGNYRVFFNELTRAYSLQAF